MKHSHTPLALMFVREVVHPTVYHVPVTHSNPHFRTLITTGQDGAVGLIAPFGWLTPVLLQTALRGGSVLEMSAPTHPFGMCKREVFSY